VHNCQNIDIIPADHILMINWGPNDGSLLPYLESYINRGGQCVIINGETDGCTKPYPEYFDQERINYIKQDLLKFPDNSVYIHESLSYLYSGNDNWHTVYLTTPTFNEIYNMMTINIKL